MQFRVDFTLLFARWTRRTRGVFWAVLPGVLFAAGVAQAQLPQARLATVFPPGGKVGSSVEVAVTGTDQEDMSQLVFSHAGITSKLAEQKFAVSIGADVPPGFYDVRMVGRFGISNPRTFVVGQRPEVLRAGTNTTDRKSTRLNSSHT